jgi:dynein regulatory complex protein 1
MIIESKQELIDIFLEQLKQKDEEYVRSLKNQKRDIEALIERMRSQFKELRGSYKTQLMEIESAFEEERNKIIDNNENDIQDKFDEHKRQEDHFLELRAKEEEDYAKQLDSLRSKDANDQQEQKIKLETEMQILEKCMEDMKAVYKLNEEKLDFNHKVLFERQNVNATTLQALRKKERRHKENLNNIHTEYDNMSKSKKEENILLTEQYMRKTK